MVVSFLMYLVSNVYIAVGFFFLNYNNFSSRQILFKILTSPRTQAVYGPWYFEGSIIDPSKYQSPYTAWILGLNLKQSLPNSHAQVKFLPLQSCIPSLKSAHSFYNLLKIWQVLVRIHVSGLSFMISNIKINFILVVALSLMIVLIITKLTHTE